VATDSERGNVGLFTISGGEFKFHPFENIPHYISPVWTADGNSILFAGIGSNGSKLFLWNKKDDTVIDITPSGSIGYIKEIAPTSDPDVYVLQLLLKDNAHITYVFRRFTLSANDITNIDICASKNIDQFNWFSSKDEDALYFFEYDNSYRFKSLLKLPIKKNVCERLLESEDIGNPYWHVYVSWSYSGKIFLFQVARCEDEMFPDLYMINIDTKRVESIRTDGHAERFALSPDGGKIVYTSGGKMYLLDSASKQIERSIGLKEFFNQRQSKDAKISQD